MLFIVRIQPDELNSTRFEHGKANLANADIATSTIILTFGANDNRISTAIGDDRFNALWHMAIETLEIINRKHPMAGQCAMALQAIRQRRVHPVKDQKRTYSPPFATKIVW